LIGILRDGLPEAAFVPGCERILLAGKRYLLVAPAGTGKSLVALVIAVQTVIAGGSVAILDVENGADEYARRLADILGARDDDGIRGALAGECSERLRYHAWPALSLEWRAEEWVDAIRPADLIVIDSSRMALSSVGLAEDSADDYARFVDALLLPPAHAGITTLLLDNTGHEATDRPRGSSSKADLNEVVYKLVNGASFDRDRAGHVLLKRQRSRFPGLPREIRINLGGETYDAPVIVEEPGEEDAQSFRPTALMERISRALEERLPGGLMKREVRAIPGKSDALDLALRILVDEEYVESRTEGRTLVHYSSKPYRQDSD
jgi:hypothetical protein